MGAEIILTGDCGQDFTAHDFGRALHEVGATTAVRVLLRSNGGNVKEGLRICELIRQHPGGVTVEAAFAGSISSYILAAGRRRVIASNGYVVIHRPRTSVSNATLLQVLEAAEALRDTRDELLAEYERCTRLSRTALEYLLETDKSFIFGPESAVAVGLADEVGPAAWPAPSPEKRSVIRRDRLSPEELAFFLGHPFEDSRTATDDTEV